MPDPVRLLNTLHRAADAFRAMPGRTGRVVRLDNAEDVLVTGDLHGNIENFRRFLERAELSSHPRRHLVFQEVVHGRWVYPAGGGDKSHQLIDLVAALKCQFPLQVHWLLGNHEMAQWTDRVIHKNDHDLNARFHRGVMTAYNDRAAEIYQAYTALFAVIPAALRTPNRIYLSHSLPTANRLGSFDPALLERDIPERADLLPGGNLYALVWGRDTSSATAEAFLKKVDADLLITGHVPCPDGFDVPNERQIILDSLGVRAGYCLFPATAPLTHAELVKCVATI